MPQQPYLGQDKARNSTRSSTAVKGAQIFQTFFSTFQGILQEAASGAEQPGLEPMIQHEMVVPQAVDQSTAHSASSPFFSLTSSVFKSAKLNSKNLEGY